MNYRRGNDDSSFSELSLAVGKRHYTVTALIGKLLKQPGSTALLEGDPFPLTRGQVKMLQEAGCRLYMCRDDGTYYYHKVDEELNVSEYTVSGEEVYTARELKPSH